jgi:hypothetical protein
VGDGAATFISKANLTDITDPLNPIGIAGNLSLIVTLTDNGEPGSSDTIGFTLWNGSELWFSSNWTGAQTEEQVLAGGNLAVHADALALQTDGSAVDAEINEQVLTPEMLEPMVEEAISRWADSLVDFKSVKALEDVKFQIADLSGSTLGLAFGNTIWIDQDAAGHGWFIDSTPENDTEFRPHNASVELIAIPTGGPYKNMDLLTVVTHELGHVLGFEDLNPETGTLMSATLGTGERRTVGDTNDQVQDDSVSLVVMEEAQGRFSSEESIGSQNSWLHSWLLSNGANDEYGPNKDIQIIIPRQESKDNPIPRRFYGKGKRA